MDPVALERAIEIGISRVPIDPHQRLQASEIIEQSKLDPSAWQVCLPLFLQTPKPSHEVRIHCLNILDNTLQKDFLHLAPNNFESSLSILKSSLFDYLSTQYIPITTPENPLDPVPLQAKLAQVFASLFVILFPTAWPTFFDDLLSLTCNNTNFVATNFFFRVLIAIHVEIADQLIARPASQFQRNNYLKDQVRASPINNIVILWQNILQSWSDHVERPETLKLCLDSLARWSSWSDLKLIVGPPIPDVLLILAGQQDQSNSRLMALRNQAIDTLAEIVSKGTRPDEKLQLIEHLRLFDLVTALLSSPVLAGMQNTPQYDHDLAEAVGKLVNTIVAQSLRILDSAPIQLHLQEAASRLLQSFISYLLRIFCDEYDEVSSTVLEGLNDIVAFILKQTGLSSAADYSAVLPTIFAAIHKKLKYDKWADYFDDNDAHDTFDEQKEFELLRRNLVKTQHQLSQIDHAFIINLICDAVTDVYSRISRTDNSVEWTDVELALFQTYNLSEMILKRTSRTDPSQASASKERLLSVWIDMMNTITTKLDDLTHPAIQKQFCDNMTKFITFFFIPNPQWIPSALTIFVTYAHSPNLQVRCCASTDLLRFVKPIRQHLHHCAEYVFARTADLLPIRAVVSEDTNLNASEDDDDSSNTPQNSVFNAQLSLFEALGFIASAPDIPGETKLNYIQAIANPIYTDLNANISAAMLGNVQAILQLIQDCQALGNIAHGFSNWSVGQRDPVPTAPPLLQQEFVRFAEAVLLVLESLKSVVKVRTAARYSFSHLLGAVGSAIFPQLLRWITGMFTAESGRQETAYFMRVLCQVIFAFRTEMQQVLNLVITPLFTLTFPKLEMPSDGSADIAHVRELRRAFLDFILAIFQYKLGDVFISQENRDLFDPVITCLLNLAQDVADVPTAKQALSIINKMIAAWGGPIIHPTRASAAAAIRTQPNPLTMPSSHGRIETRKPSKSSAAPLSPVDPENSFSPAEIRRNSELQRENAVNLPLTRRLVYGDIGIPQPRVPDFDKFTLATIAPACWSILANTKYKNDGSARRDGAAAAAANAAAKSSSSSSSSLDAQTSFLLQDVINLQLEILRRTGVAYLRLLEEQHASIGVSRETMDSYLDLLGC